MPLAWIRTSALHYPTVIYKFSRFCTLAANDSGLCQSSLSANQANMKKTTLILTISAAIAASGYAAPFLAVGDNAELFLTAQAGARWDSNIYLTPSNTDDIVLNFSPGLEFDFGKNSNTQGLFRVSENFTAYNDHDQLNSSLPSAAFNAAYDDGKSKASAYMSYDELNQNSVFASGHGDYLIRNNVFATGAAGEISLTQKTSVAAGVDYRWTDYRTTGFSDSDVASLPLHYYYEVSPKVDLGLGYRYRQTWMQFGEDTYDHFFSVAARGDFTPKLSGKLDVGLTNRHFKHASDTSLLGVDASLNYAVSPKTGVLVFASNDFDTNAQAEQTKTLAFGTQVSATVSDTLSFVAGASYRAIHYYHETDVRTDDYVEGQVGVTYTVSVNANFTAAVAYRENSSDLALANFNGTVFSIAANFRY